MIQARHPIVYALCRGLDVLLRSSVLIHRHDKHSSSKWAPPKPPRPPQQDRHTGTPRHQRRRVRVTAVWPRNESDEPLPLALIDHHPDVFALPSSRIIASRFRRPFAAFPLCTVPAAGAPDQRVDLWILRGAINVVLLDFEPSASERGDLPIAVMRGQSETALAFATRAAAQASSPTTRTRPGSAMMRVKMGIFGDDSARRSPTCQRDRAPLAFGQIGQRLREIGERALVTRQQRTDPATSKRRQAPRPSRSAVARGSPARSTGRHIRRDCEGWISAATPDA